MQNQQYNGVILEDKWGKTYLCSSCLLAYADLGEGYISDVNDKEYGRYFLHDLEPHWNLRQIWVEMYQHVKPWALDLSKFTDFQLRDALLQIFSAGEMRVWQLSEGWGKQPEGNGIGEGRLAPQTSSNVGPATVSKKALKPGGGVTPANSSNATTAVHSSITTNTVAPTATDDIANNPAARKALYVKHGIEVGPYKELQKITKPGYQREHFIPHSCFMVRSVASGESRANVPIGAAFGSYNEGDAITYFVFDDQSKGTEHRYLTDIEKNYAKSLNDAGEYATVNQWLDHMEHETATSLCMDTIERSPGVYEARVPDDEAKLVAKAIRIDTESYLDSAGVNKNAPLSNLVGGGDVPGGTEIGSGDDF
ncbi:hypothetical protein [Rheinheimera nanhaiensis]|uniref:Uncharacterized protein n=1 Tax=Rheinheimera nanhaiensis E407-8 TaxID=562729 RepID=I1DTA8_9GAMM|nr:hypothetical protein [Rheinheimera nanhaiensis]GAB57286.1 hypothetical protein RNAN_0249 [Rheinheimera nanhaiensis E407-8]